MDAVIHPDWLGWKAGTSTCSDACREWSLSCLLTQTCCDMFVHELLRVMEYNLPPATRLAPLLSLSLTHTHARTDTNTAACEITPLHKVEQSCHIWPKCMFMILPGWQTHLLTDYLWRFFSSTVQRVSVRPHPGESFVILLCFNSCWKARGNTCIWKTYIYITHWYLHTHNGKMIVLWHFVRVEFIYDTLIGSSIC